MGPTHRPAELDLTADFVAEYAALLARPVGSDRSEADDLRGRLAAAEGERDALRQSRDALQAESARLAESAQTLELRLAAAVAESQGLDDQLRALREQVSKLKTERDAPPPTPAPPGREETLARALDEREKEIDVLRDEADELKQRLSNANYRIYQLEQGQPAR